MSPLTTQAFGPFSAGITDTRNPSVPPNTSLRYAQNLLYTGVFDLSIRPGTQIALSLFDDQMAPFSVDSVVLAATPFQDGALAMAWSNTTHKCYLYRLNAELNNWYDVNGNPGGSFSANPIGVVWSSMTSVPDVSVTEGLGAAYIANCEAADVNGLYWPTKVYYDYGTATVTGLTTTTLIFPATFALSSTVAITKNGTPLVVTTDYTRAGAVFTLVVAAISSDVFDLTFSAGIDTLLVNGTGGAMGTDTAYFNGVVAFQQACWGFGYGAGNAPGYTSYRPELARFSPPSFQPFQVEDSLTLGDRVRSERERIIAGVVAGNALFLGGASLLTRITGYGRDSWYKTVLDRSYGFVGPKCAVAVGDTLYYWSTQGPCRVSDSGPVDPLFDALPAAVATVANPQTIIAGFDLATNQVLFFYDSGNFVRMFCAFDIRRNVWLGPASDIGIALVSAGSVLPYTASTAVAPDGPSGPPTIVSTTLIGTSVATANWTNADSLVQSEIDWRVQGTTPWPFSVTGLAPGVIAYTMSGLIPGTAYEWRVRSVRNGQYTSYVGPSSLSQFTTVENALLPPYNVTSTIIFKSTGDLDYLTWSNSGETDASTLIQYALLGVGVYYLTVGPGVGSATIPLARGSWQIALAHTAPNNYESPFTAPIFVVIS